MSSKPTIALIAQEARVSPATVSRVINHQGIVKGETYTRVVEVLRRLNYPFYGEPGARKEDGGLILLNLPSFDNPFYSEVVSGAKTSAARHGYHLLINSSHINSSTLPTLIELLNLTKAAGLITLNHVPPDILMKLNNIRPLVQCCEYDENLDLPFVSIDDLSGARQMVEYLLSTGRRRIAFICGPARYKYARHRLQGYQSALAAAGVPSDPDLIVQLPEVRYDLAISSAMQMLNSSNPPDSFFTSSDVYAMAAIRAAHLAGRRVPQDVMVTGFDNIEFCSMTIPSITTINQPKTQLGFMACELLLEKITMPDSPNKKVLLETELIIRESTASGSGSAGTAAPRGNA